MIATTVLIITCPCALALAVPAVQVMASQYLLKQGILLKSGDGLERLDKIDTIIFDKTGTLTEGRAQLINTDDIPSEDLQLAASLAVHSKHPLCRALASAWKGDLIPLMSVKEVPSCGLEAEYAGSSLRLGRADWCGVDSAQAQAEIEIWLIRADQKAARFVFADALRQDAKDVVSDLKKQGFDIHLLSGDRDVVVRKIALQAGIGQWQASLSPVDKTNVIQDFIAAGRKVLMVGDGLNDAASLACASVSMSPSTAIDITQNAADVVFQGFLLKPVKTTIFAARKSAKLVRQNFALSFAYNVLAVPLALMGLVTPLIAAVAMSTSSILVVINALRLGREVK